MEEFDLIVIGGGRASNLAIAAATAGKNVALIERDRLGGTCPNRGCVPSKLLIGYAEVARRVREADRHFISAKLEGVDLERIFSEVSDYVNQVDARYESRLPENLILIRGHAEFVADKRIRIRESEQELTAETIVIAVGTRPRPHPFPDLPAWSSDDLFPLKAKIPQSLAIIGGGFIGCELGAFFSAIGIPTALYVRSHHLLPNEDHEIGEIFCDEFTRHTPTHFGHSLKDLVHDGRSYKATFVTDDGERSIEVDQVLFATGRISNADQLGLEHTQIEVDRRGFIVTDDHLQSTVPGVYAAGDSAGRFVLQHAASYDIHYLRQHLLKGDDSPIDYGAMPHAVYSDPEVASVGLTENQLREQGTPFVRVMRDWKSSARSMATRLDYPRAKLLVSPEDYSILGCHLIGPESSTLIHEVLMLIHLENDVRRLPEIIHIHPALSEIFLGLALDAVKAIESND